MYAMFEHSFYTRAAKDGSKEDEARGVFKFLPLVAPIKATVFPLLQKPELNEVGEWGLGGQGGGREVLGWLWNGARAGATVFPLLQKPWTSTRCGEWGQGCRRERGGCRGARSSKGRAVGKGLRAEDVVAWAHK